MARWGRSLPGRRRSRLEYCVIVSTNRRNAALAFVACIPLVAIHALVTPAPARALSVATLVQQVDTSTWSPASPDPSGLEYLPAPHDQLVVADGEVDETTGATWQNVNVWFAPLSNPLGQPTGQLNTKASSPTNNEPVGIAYDESQGELYVSKDGSNSRVWVYRSGVDGRFGTSDDVMHRSFAISTRGVADGEGLAFGAGRLWVTDGSAKEVWWFAPGPDGIIGTVDDPQGHWDTAVLGQPDPEGIDYDPETGNLWIVSNARTSGLLEVTTDGDPVRTVPLALINPQHPGGLAVAPSSTGQGMSVWIADRGVDNASDPGENDGRLYELAISDEAPPPSSGNLLLNGGFEQVDGSGRPAAWTPDPHFTRSQDTVRAGTYAGQHRATDGSGYKVTQDVAVRGDAQYDLSGYVSVPPTTDAFKLLIKVQWRSGGTLSTATVAKFTKATSGYVQWSASLTAPSTATTARVMMVVSSLNTTVYVDDFALIGR